MKKIVLNKITAATAAALTAAVLAIPILQASVLQAPVIASAAESTFTSQPAKRYYVTADILNVRSGPGRDYSVLGSLTQGMRVKVISIKGEKGNRWAKIRFAGVTAYVSAKYLAENE